MFSESMRGNIAWGLSTNRGCDDGAMIKINILGVEIPLISFNYYPDMFKTYQRKTKLFELSLVANEEELKWRKGNVVLQLFLCNGFVVVASFRWPHWNGFLAMAFLHDPVCCNRFCFSSLSMLTNTATTFLGDGMHWKLLTRRQGFPWSSSTNFFIMATGQWMIIYKTLLQTQLLLHHIFPW